jgi:hypothetical protein
MKNKIILVLLLLVSSSAFAQNPSEISRVLNNTPQTISVTSASANNANIIGVLDLTTNNGYRAIAFSLSGTYVAQLQAQGSNDNANFDSIPLGSPTDQSFFYRVSTENKAYVFNTVGYRYVRVRVVQYTSGTIGGSANGYFSSSDLSFSATIANTTTQVAGTVDINNINGTVSLPTGASTSALQTTGNSSLSSIDTKLTNNATTTLQTTGNSSLSSIDTKLTNNATTTLQTTGNTSLGNIDTKIPSNLTVTSTRLLVDPSGVTQPISAASLPLPTGAATETTVNTLLKPASTLSAVTTLGTITNVVKVDDNGGSLTIDASSLPLPTGASTSALQTTGNTSLGNIDTKLPSNLTVTSTRLLTDGSGVTQPISASALPLPTGAATSALQTTGNTTLGTIDTKLADVSTATLQTSGNASLTSIDGKLPPLGQALAAASVPVVLTASQLSTLTPTTGLTDAQLRASAVPISASALPLPSGASTSALQTTGNTSLSSIDTKVPSGLVVTSGRLQVELPSGASGLTDAELRASAVPVSASALPLPSGASTSALQSTIDASINNLLKPANTLAAVTTVGTITNVVHVDDNSGSITVDASSLPLPTGASTSALQTTGNTSLGNIDTKIPSNLTVTSTRLLVDGSGVTQPISASSLPLPTGAATAAGLTTINSTLGSPFQAGGSIGNTSFAATQATAANLNATVVGTGTFATQISTALPTGSNTIGAISNTSFAATQSGTWNIGSITTLPSLVAGTATIGNVNQTQGTAGFGKIADGTNVITLNPASTVAASTAVSIPIAILPNNNLVKLTDGTNTATVKAASTAAVAADQALVVSLSPNTNKTGSEQSSAAATGTTISLIGGAATTAAPSYTTGQANPLSLTLTGHLRTNDEATSATAAAVPTSAIYVGTSTTTASPTYTTATMNALSTTVNGDLRVISKPTPVDISVTVTAATGVAATLTLPAAGAGLFHYITKIEIEAYPTATVAGGATPIIVTSTNISGTPSWNFASARTIGVQQNRDIDFMQPLKSAAANTATTIVMPVATTVLWKAKVYYYTAP